MACLVGVTALAGLLWSCCWVSVNVDLYLFNEDSFLKRLRASFSFFVFHSSELADIIQKKIKMYSDSLVCQELCIVLFFTVLFCCCCCFVLFCFTWISRYLFYLFFTGEADWEARLCVNLQAADWQTAQTWRIILQSQPFWGNLVH